MESLSVLLEPHKDTISNLASYVTYLQQLSGAVMCNSIRKQGSTAGQPVMPFLFGTLISLIAFRFASIIDDGPTMRVNLIGTALNIVYLCVYFYYTNNVKDKMEAWSQIGYGGAFIAAVYAYTFIENPENLPFRYGLIFTGLMFYFIGMTLFMVIEAIRKKNTDGLPFPMIVSGTLMSSLWLLYGIATREYFTICQNLLFFFLSIFQLSLFVIFPSKTVKSKKNGVPFKNTVSNKKQN